MPYQAARDMEVELAIALREQGYASGRPKEEPQADRSVDQVRDDLRGPVRGRRARASRACATGMSSRLHQDLAVASPSTVTKVRWCCGP